MSAASPDGRWLAYHRLLDGQRDIWIVSLSGGSPLRFTDHPALDVQPAWSPDGRAIAFVSDRSGTQHVWVAAVADGRPAGPARQVTTGAMSQEAPAWSPDSARIAYVEFDDKGNREVWTVAASGGAAHQVTRSARAWRVGWDRQAGSLFVSGFWNEDRISLRRIPADSEPRGVPEPLAWFDADYTRADFDVSNDGRLLVSRLSVILTAACNLGCAYCYQNAKQPRRMTWETLRAALDLLREARGREVRLLFTGGEPLLECDLIERAVSYVDAIRAPDLRIRYEMVTNGTLLGEEQAAFLAAHDFSVQLGFDGVPAAQDLRGPGTFARLDALLGLLRQRHPAFYRDSVSVAVTLVPETIPILADSVKYFFRKDVAEVLISPAITYQPGWSDEALPELDRQFGRIYRASLERFHQTGNVPLLLFRKAGRRARRAQRPLPMCPVADRRQVVVDVDGQLYGCVLFAESYQRFPTEFLRRRLERLRMGDVHAPNLDARIDAFGGAARATDILRAKEDKHSAYARCAECRYLESCEICPGSIGHQPNNEDPGRMPDFPCAVTRVALKYRARFPRQKISPSCLGGAPEPRPS